MREAELRDGILIIGAGCAGLSLAVHLVEAGVTSKPILLLDSRKSYPRDHTWCFWKVGPHPFERCVTRQWENWHVAHAGEEARCHSTDHPYQHIPADVFYREALARLARAPNVQVCLSEKVQRVEDTGACVTIQTDRRTLTAPLVMDSRPVPARDVAGHGPGVRLLQHFVGHFVRVRDPVFDPETVTLMDFQAHEREGVHFMYVLPYSRTEALVEATWISNSPFRRNAYRQSIQDYLGRVYAQPQYLVMEEEWGQIPMSTMPTTLRASRRVYRIGTAGGLVRPSTGYAFMAIQRVSAELARRISLGNLPDPVPPYRPRTALLDRVFLSFLKNHPGKAPHIFLTLFRNIEPDRLVRFLSDAGTLADDLRVILSMPTRLFTREALRSSRPAWSST